MLGFLKVMGATFLFFILFGLIEEISYIIISWINGDYSVVLAVLSAVMASWVSTIVAITVNDVIFKEYATRVVAIVIFVILLAVSIVELVTLGAGDGKIDYLFLLENATVCVTIYWFLWRTAELWVRVDLLV